MSAKTRSLTANRTVEQGRTHWLIKGQTKPYVELLRDAGADWDASKIAWRYDGDELPPAITNLLSDLQSLNQPQERKPSVQLTSEEAKANRKQTRRDRNEGGGGIPKTTKDTLKRIKKGSTVYAKKNIYANGEQIVPMNSKGTVVSRGKNALNVQFDTHPHIVLCTWDMITDQPIPYEQTPGYQIDQETTEAWRRGGINDAALESLVTDKWVSKVNKLAREIDEDADSMHPSAHREALGEQMGKFVKLASGGTHQSVDDLVTAHVAASKPVHPTSLAKGNPLREQYLAVKKDYESCILFWRLGDFYETFDEDAEVAARELDLVLTSRPVSKDERIAMAGVPQHALEQYIPKLLKAGYSVAVAEQFPKYPLLAGGIVERRVTRVETP